MNSREIANIAIDAIFWILVFVLLLINFYAAGAIFLYGENHDHHLAFFTYLGGMASNGLLGGIDFYSPHSVFVPIIFGLFFKILGISQISLGIIDGILVFITMIFIYKTSRFVLPSVFSKLAIAILLLSHGGRYLPWFNDATMLFVAMGVYFIASHIHENKPYKTILVGIICFALPYLRQQALVPAVVLLTMPAILYYLGFSKKEQYYLDAKYILSAFLGANVAFILFVLLWNGFSGLEILLSSFTSLVAMSQPAIAYESGLLTVASYILDYTAQGYDWHGYFIRFLSYWFIVIIPVLYFIFRPISLRASKKEITKIDAISFVCALVVASTIVFNYPINEDARMRVAFGIGIWLFIYAIYLCFYNKNAKILSFFAIAIVILSLNHSKLYEFILQTRTSFEKITILEDGFIQMESSTPYSGMKFRESYARHMNSLLDTLNSYSAQHPQKAIIFDGELVNINAFLYLLFSAPKVVLQHKFPYYYGYFDRSEIFSDIGEKYSEFVAQNKPIIIGCKDEFSGVNSDKWAREANYQVLANINKSCNILIPKEEND